MFIILLEANPQTISQNLSPFELLFDLHQCKEILASLTMIAASAEKAMGFPKAYPR